MRAKLKKTHVSSYKRTKQEMETPEEARRKMKRKKRERKRGERDKVSSLREEGVPFVTLRACRSQ